MNSEFLELIPIALVGFFAGFISVLENKEITLTKNLISALQKILVSSFLCVITYSLLSAVDLPYLAKVGISACVGFLGFDKALNIIKELISLRKG